MNLPAKLMYLRNLVNFVAVVAESVQLVKDGLMEDASTAQPSVRVFALDPFQTAVIVING